MGKRSQPKEDPMAVDIDSLSSLHLSSIDPFAVGETPAHLQQVLDLNKKFMDMFREYVSFLESHPQSENSGTTAGELEVQRQTAIEVERMRRRVVAQLSLVKTANRAAILRHREEKERTAKKKSEMDSVVLQWHNLKYEEESLQKEIFAAENYDHKYTKLPLIPETEFLDKFPEFKGKDEAEVMEARIEYEYKERVLLEEQRQEKLKRKQELIAEVKRRKADLDRLDQRLEGFIDAAKPIEETLATE